MNVQQKLALKFIRTKLNLLSLVSKKKAAEEAFNLFCTPPMKMPFKEHAVYQKGERLQFSLNGRVIKGYRCNHPAPEKVMILHGFSSSAYNFHFYVQPLIDKGYEVLAFDAPAHGASEGKTTDALEYSEMIKKACKLYGPVTKFIAHSFGGISLMLALEDMDHDAHTKVVLIAPATETSTAIEGALKILALRDPGIRNLIDEIILKKSGKETKWFSIRRAISNIRANVLWLHDEDDDITPLADAMQVHSDNHTHVNFVITKKLGHRKIYRDATVKKQIIDFL